MAKGFRFSEESKEKMRKAHLGKKLSAYHIAQRTKGQKGLSKSEEWKKKVSLAHKGKKRSVESRKKQTVWQTGRSGEKSNAWKGGITPINAMIRTSKEYKLWRTAVFERDNYTCIWGGKEHGSKLHADHIKPFCNYPELRFAIDNGRTLCEDCHRKTDTFGSKAMKK